jgi:hypothetical protein
VESLESGQRHAVVVRGLSSAVYYGQNSPSISFQLSYINGDELPRQADSGQAPEKLQNKESGFLHGQVRRSPAEIFYEQCGGATAGATVAGDGGGGGGGAPGSDGGAHAQEGVATADDKLEL